MDAHQPERIVVGITGASGAVYAVRTIELLATAGVEVHVALTPLGRRLLHDELDIKRPDADALSGGHGDRVVLHGDQDVGAAIASGSHQHGGMVVVPASSNTIAALATGLGNTLVQRAAAVTLKERRTLIVAHRESPLTLIDLENMRRLAAAGAIIAPLAPGFYMRPQRVEDLVDFMAGRMLDLLGVKHDLDLRWTGERRSDGATKGRRVSGVRRDRPSPVAKRPSPSRAATVARSSFGAHLSIAGGMERALEEAGRLRMDCVQVFTKNQRQWRVKPLVPEEIEAWRNALRALGWTRSRGRARVVSHNSYLINLASPDRAAWERSIDLQRIELERCETLGIPLCVSHPGAHLGRSRPPGEPHDLEAPPTRDERAGLRRIVRALDRLHRALPGYRVRTCLETTVGSGSNLGYAFHHLAFIRDHLREPERVGFCLDTCHVTAAGYDMTTEPRARAVLRAFDEACGLASLRVLHLNDSVGAVGSRKDRHAHIGQGACGMACFRTILNRRALSRVPKILETPKGTNDAGISWDLANIRRLKRLIRAPGTSR